MIRYDGGKQTLIPEKHEQRFEEEYTPGPSTPEECRVLAPGTDGVYRVELTPPPKGILLFQNKYIRELDPLRETTAGTATIDAGSTGVTGHSALFTEAQSGWYFRVDVFGTHDDSEWYRISSITNDSTITLSSAFGLSGATSASYSVSAAPVMPPLMHRAILYGSVMDVMSDQNDPTFVQMGSKMTATIQKARVLWKTRIYSQEIETMAADFTYRR